MPWPLSQDYNEAIQSPAANFADPDLRGSEAVTNALGIPMPYAGNYADVYQVRGPDGTRWAVKCFTREVPGLRERYRAISTHLRQARLPFTVEFDYLEQGILIAGQWYPVVKMEWVEGLTLNEFVSQYVARPAMLAAFLRIWAKMARFLTAARVTHGDLQHGNVLLVPGEADTVSLKLIDYDGLWVPALANIPSGEAGHPAYQHPQRLREGGYNPYMDRFPVLLVGTALTALQVAGPALWAKYNTGDNLLFSRQDLEAPSKSRLFYELLKTLGPAYREMVEALIEAARKPMEETPLLEEVLAEAREVAPQAVPTPAPAVPVARKLIPPPVPQPIPEILTMEPEIVELSPVKLPAPAPPVRLNPAVLWALAGGFLFFVLGLAGVLFFILRAELGTHTSGHTLAVAHGSTATNTGHTAATSTSPPVSNDSASSASEDPKPPAPGEPSPDKKQSSPGPQPTEQGTIKAQAPTPVATETIDRVLGKHDSWVTRLVFSPDGTRLASLGSGIRPMPGGPRAGDVKLWDVKTGQELFTLKGHTNIVDTLWFNPDGTRIVTKSTDQTIRIWDTGSGKELRVIAEPNRYFRDARFSPDGTYVASVDTISADLNSRLSIWDPGSGKRTREIELQHPADKLAFSSDGKRIATFGAGHILQGKVHSSPCKIWDAASGQLLRTIETTKRGFVCAQFSPDGTRLANGEHAMIQQGQIVPGDLKVWDTETGREQLALGGMRDIVDLAFSADGSRLAAAGAARVTVWDARSGKELLSVNEHGGLMFLSLSADGNLLAATDMRITKVWKVPSAPADPQVTEALAVDAPQCHRVCLSPDGKQIATGAIDGSVGLHPVSGTWVASRMEKSPDLSKSEPPAPPPAVKPPVGEARRFAGHQGEVRRLSVSADGSRLLTAGWDRTIRLWDVEAGTQLQEWGDLPQRVHSVALLPDGRRALYCVDNDRTVYLCDLISKTAIRSYTGHKNGVTHVAVSEDGHLALGCGVDGLAILWDVESGKSQLRLEPRLGPLETVAFSKNGHLALGGSRSGWVVLWDLQSGQERKRFKAHQKTIMGLAFSPNGTLAASCALEDKAVRIWRLDNYHELKQFNGQTQDVYAVAFSHDGTRVLTGGGDGTVRLWDEATGKELHTFQGHDKLVWSVAFSPDDKYAFSASADQTARLWRLPDP